MKFPAKNSVIFIFLFMILLPEKSYPVSPEDLAASQLNYAYSNYLGTGIYSAADRSVKVLHLPFRYTLRETTQDKGGLRLRLPVTVGVVDIDYFDQIFPTLPDRFETLTFVPGIQYIHQVNDYWRLSPFVDFGMGHDFATDNNAYVYGAGVNSLFVFKYNTFNLEIYNEFLFAGNTTEILSLIHI